MAPTRDNLQQEIHQAICDDSLEFCRDWDGACGTATSRLLARWPHIAAPVPSDPDTTRRTR